MLWHGTCEIEWSWSAQQTESPSAWELFDPQVKSNPIPFFELRVSDPHGEPHAVVTISCHPRLAGKSKSAGLRRIIGVGRDLFWLKLRLLREPPHGGRIGQH